MQIPATEQTVLSESRPRSWWQEQCRSLTFLCRVVLRNAFDDKFHDFGILQQNLADFLDPIKNPSQKKLISIFRGSYKTTDLLGLFIYLFVWAVEEGRPYSAIYNTATKENAEAFMDDFRHILTDCVLLRWIFPKLDTNPEAQFDKFTKWKVEYKGVRFHAASLDTRQVSRHYIAVINDDLVNDDNAYSETERENVKRKWRFQKSILTRYKKFKVGLEIDCGTPYHGLDLMADLINHSKKYEKFIVPYAIPLESESKVDLKSHSGLLTFPEMYCWEDFEDIYEDQGASIFATQYELKVLPDSDRIAQEEWLQDWKVLPAVRQRLVICDPAGTEKKQNDPSGFLVVDISPEPRLYVLYAKQFWLTPYNVIEMLKTLDDVYKPDEIYVEKEKYSIGMMDTIDHYFDGTMFSFVEHSNEAPEKRIYRLKQWVETRRILFSDDQTDLKYQLLNYPDVKHDHLLVCLAYAVKVMNPPKKTKVLPYEEQVAVGFDAELEKMQRIWNRKGMDYDKYF